MSLNNIKESFVSFNYRLLGKSIAYVFYLSLFSLAPLLVCILISWISTGSLRTAWETVIVPGEMIAFALSAIVPIFVLVYKTQSWYKLPWLAVFGTISLLTYISTFVVYIIGKFHFVPAIGDEKSNTLYYKFALAFLAISYICWIYTVFHEENSMDYSKARNSQQQDFNSNFANAINQQQ